METIYEKLFYSYGESVLNQLEDHYDGEEIFCQLEGLSLEPKVRLRLEDLFYDYYGRWSADAFALGLHLGLSLFHSHVCRGRVQQADEVAGG